ncbi:MAG: hypothetical protein K2O34_05310 [Acetatifactor sp.]|nr:hypothetical protein [Acetatifactor sp.]
MLCEVCKRDMIPVRRGSVQGWSCPDCGWGVLTTYIDEMYLDTTDYCIYVRNITDINKDIIKLISGIAGVNYLAARQMLVKGDACILKAKAPEIKRAIEKLQEADILFAIIPEFQF